NTFNDAMFRVGCTPADVRIIQKQVTLRTPEANIDGRFFTLAFKYTTEAARRNGWRGNTDPTNLWSTQTDINTATFATDPLSYVMDRSNNYRNKELMNEVFNSPDAYYVLIEVYNMDDANDKRLVGNMLFEKRQGSRSFIDWFAAANVVTGVPNSPNINRAGGYQFFSIAGHADIARRWFINLQYNGCHGDPTMMVIPYGSACWWDNVYRGRIFLSKEGPINMGGANNYYGVNGRNYYDMIRFYTGTVMQVWVCRKTNDPYQTANVVQANCRNS
ncbi:hypothetical protein EBT25_16370, partial [bacterium]|nr:hypothetical protein [bacterium]